MAEEKAQGLEKILFVIGIIMLVMVMITIILVNPELTGIKTTGKNQENNSASKLENKQSLIKPSSETQNLNIAETVRKAEENIVEQNSESENNHTIKTLTGQAYNPEKTLQQPNNAIEWETSLSTNEQYITALKTFNGKLYAGTNNGNLFAFDGKDWQKIEGQPVETIKAMEVFNNKLYIATIDKGKIYEFDGSKLTVKLDNKETEPFEDLAVYNGKLYATSNYSEGKMYSFDGTQWKLVWSKKYASGGNLAEYKEKLYIGTFLSGKILAFDGKETKEVFQTESKNINALETFNGKLFAAGSFKTDTDNPKGTIYAFDGIEWKKSFETGTTHINTLLVFEKMLVAAGNFGKVYYIYDENSMVEGKIPEYTISALAEYNGKLYAGTQNGKVYVQKTG